ncbi:MAG: tetratricopeptide (TPR) repeat protein [Cryomorphaceae bacterium]|jgi:tetratricopeptide (TPR) repeat protein
MEKIDTKKGNDEYRSGRYDEAIKDYTKALENAPEYMEAIFNTGNALQQMARRLQEQAQNAGSEEEKKELITGAKTASEKAASQFASVAKMAKTNEEINKAQYNLGNSRLMSGELDAGIEAYKEALRKVPNDDDARYNLAYAQHLKKQQEQQQQQQDQKQDEQQDQEKKEQEQNQDQQNQEKQNQEQQEPQQLSKEEAEQLLQALMKQEKDLQEELKKKKNRKAQRIKIEKDW